MPVNKKISFSILYVFLAIFAVVLVHDFIVAMQKVEELPYSEFKTLLTAGKVAEITLTQQRLTGKLKQEEGSKEQKLFTTVRVEDPDLVKELNAHNVRFNGVIEMDSKNFERDPVTRNRVLDRKERVQLCRRGAEELFRRFPRVRIL